MSEFNTCCKLPLLARSVSKLPTVRKFVQRKALFQQKTSCHRQMPSGKFGRGHAPTLVLVTAYWLVTGTGYWHWLLWHVTCGTCDMSWHVSCDLIWCVVIVWAHHQTATAKQSKEHKWQQRDKHVNDWRDWRVNATKPQFIVHSHSQVTGHNKLLIQNTWTPGRVVKPEFYVPQRFLSWSVGLIAREAHFAKALHWGFLPNLKSIEALTYTPKTSSHLGISRFFDPNEIIHRMFDCAHQNSDGFNGKTI